MKKRNAAVLLVVIMLMFTFMCLIGCEKNNQGDIQTSSDENSSSNQKNTDSNSKEIVVEWWTPNWDEPESREMASEFETANPGTKVKLVITDWDTYKNKIMAAISTKNAPELYTVLTTDVRPFSKMGFLEPLDEWITKEKIDKDDFLSAALDIATIDNNIYGLPFRHDGSGMYYNVELLKNAGYEEFPKNWDEFTDMCKKITTDDVYGFAWPLGHQANAVTRFVQQIYTEGGEILNEDETKCFLDSPEAVAALTNIVSSLQEGYASPNSLEYDNTKMRDAFGSGQLAVLFSGPFEIDALKKDYPELNFKTAVIPGKDGMGCTTSNGWTIVMGSKSKNKDVAAKLLAYLITPENQARLTDSFPASYTALKYEQFTTEELKPFAEQLENSKAEPAYARWPEIEPIIYSYIQQAACSKISIEDACKKMTDDINNLLAS